MDLTELRDFLSEAGALDIFGANSVQEVMSIFDTDGNGTLDSEELATLMEFIEEEKARMLAMGENKEGGTLPANLKTGGSINVSERKLQTITKLEESLDAADADGDGNIDLEEVSCVRCCRIGLIFFRCFRSPLYGNFCQLICAMLQLRLFLKVSGAASLFGANGAEEVMKIFDSDGSVPAKCSFFRGKFVVDVFCSNGYLDAEEFGLVKEFIETEKKVLLMKR